MSLEGEYWCRIDEDFGIAARPVIVQRSVDTVILVPGTKRAGAADPAPPTEGTPLATAMFKPFPNPFNPTVKLSFSLASAMPVELRIFDLQGALVATLVDRTYSAGRHTVPWSGCDGAGRDVASGVYVARLVAGRLTQTYRLALIR